MTTPVVLFIYNRPRTTRRVVAALAAMEPECVYVFADGPRAAEDAAQCAAARAVVDGFDWRCPVERDYSDVNLGMRRRIGGGVTAVLGQFETAVILEDDCVPHPTFMRFCSELLQRYRDDERVMTICGSNPLLRWREGEQSYGFSRYPIGWGWATWRRAWQHYDDSMSRWNDAATHDVLRAALPDEAAYRRLVGLYQRVYDGRIDAWDCRWTLACLLRQGLAVVPALNLVSNIGFGGDASHTRQAQALGANMPALAMEFPLRHPAEVAADGEFERLYQRWLRGEPDPRTVAQHARQALADGRPLRALMLVSALCEARPELAQDDVIGPLRDEARHAVEERRR